MAWSTIPTVTIGYLITAAWLNQYLRDNLTYLSTNMVVNGVIALWSGSTGSIPTGWSHNNGTGTVDLRNKWIRGAGSTYNPGDTGGALTFTPGAHGSHTLTQPDHSTHTMSGPTAHPLHISQPDPSLNWYVATDGGAHTPPSATGGHSHANAALSSHSTHSALDTTPPYYALAYVQKVSGGTGSFTTPKTWTTGEVPTAAQMNADVRDNVNVLAAAGVPAGIIALWYSTTSTIPSNWAHCNGSGGTVDLRDRMVVAAGSTYSVGATGGAATSAVLAAHSSHTATQPDAHGSHTMGQPATHSEALLADALYSGTTAYMPHSHTGAAINGHSSHTGFAVDAHAAHNAVSLLPPYRALPFMQNVSTGLTTPKTWTTSEVVKAAHFNTYIRDNLTGLYRAFPVGAIVNWYSSVASIPTGWALCNGSGGTVDMRDKFAIGAGSTYSPNATGGATSAALSDHAAHVVTQPTNHSDHIVTQPTASALHGTLTRSVGTTYSSGSTIYESNSHSGMSASAHSAHAFTVTGAHSHASPVTTVPPYYALAFIQRTS